MYVLASLLSHSLTLSLSASLSLTDSLCLCLSLFQVTSRPTICLINFVLSGKPVLLEQPRKANNSKLITHLLTCHGGREREREGGREGRRRREYYTIIENYMFILQVVYSCTVYLVGGAVLMNHLQSVKDGVDVSLTTEYQ